MQYLDLTSRKDTVIVCGDIHCEFRTLVFNLEQKHVTDAIIIVAGDCGFGFDRLPYYSQLYRHLHKKLEKLNDLLLMVRGNHDDPVYFSGEVIDFPFMKTLPDYTIVHTQSHNILCVGGAISVDRSFRKTMMIKDSSRGKRTTPIYWPKEAVIYDESELETLEKEKIKINTVITHTAPSFCPPYTNNDLEHWCAGDENLADDIRRERRDMDKLYTYLILHNHPLHQWYYGHYHTSDRLLKDDTQFFLLDIMEMKAITPLLHFSK